MSEIWGLHYSYSLGDSLGVGENVYSYKYSGPGFLSFHFVRECFLI